MTILSTQDGQVVRGDNPLPTTVYGPNGQPLFASARTAADNLSLPAAPDVLATLLAYDGAGLDLWRSNLEQTVLASAARSATTVGADQTNNNARGAMFILNVTAQPGGGESISVRIQARDALGNYVTICNAVLSFTAATGIKVHTLYPGADLAGTGSGGSATGTSNVLPRTWRAIVDHSGAGVWTYSLSCQYVV